MKKVVFDWVWLLTNCWLRKKYQQQNAILSYTCSPTFQSLFVFESTGKTATLPSATSRSTTRNRRLLLYCLTCMVLRSGKTSKWQDPRARCSIQSSGKNIKIWIGFFNFFLGWFFYGIFVDFISTWLEFISWYCWWFSNPANCLVNDGINYLPTGAGFLPSTASFVFGIKSGHLQKTSKRQILNTKIIGVMFVCQSDGKPKTITCMNPKIGETRRPERHAGSFWPIKNDWTLWIILEISASTVWGFLVFAFMFVFGYCIPFPFLKGILKREQETARIQKVASRELSHIRPKGKRKRIFQSALGGDMLLPRRVSRKTQPLK